MRQAIVTKFLGPTNHRGSRIQAKSQAKRLTVSWDHARGPEWNHRFAAASLALDLGWLKAAEYHRIVHADPNTPTGSRFNGGALPNGKGYAFVFSE